ncbi:IclR family transcriptional regulator domain-containing protein [Rhodococcus qingshengii]|uniref:IclR family transcriptional regulator domain-containing protein n=1 Tax=Rhodococcus qingshengii TaxID=334542 RepID=UPI0022B35E8E|nr:IclR family transcriptional regulator C-terminal domain-containing protein [Rhodococcus qingshengii]MCZ4618617.1 helix-turn-helix domain-containing protein [Rhodococcus qingshengii]
MERAITILTAFDAEYRSMTLTQVTERCRLPRSAARRFLHTLVELGYVSHAGRRFELTAKVLELGYANVSRFTLADVCQPHVDILTRNLNASSSVAVLDGTDIRYVCRAEAATGMAVALKAGSRIPAHVTAAGRVLLAAQPDSDIESYLSLALGRNDSWQLSTAGAERLKRELETVRCQGWAFADQLIEVGVRAIAVPLRSRGGREVGALTVSMYESFEPPRVLVPRCLPPLLEAAGTISLELRTGIEF